MNRIPNGQLSEENHLLAHVVYSNSPVMKTVRISLVVILTIAGLAVIYSHISRFIKTDDFRKDFLAIYVLANAIPRGYDITLPIDDLAVHFIEDFHGTAFPHPTPHPPTMGIVFSPLALFSYRTAKCIWIVLQFIFLFFSFHQLTRLLGLNINKGKILILAIILQSWYPVYLDVSNGQVNYILLFLLTGTCLANKNKQFAFAGILLGISLIIKQIAWPILLLFLLHRNIRAILSCAITGIAAYSLAVALTGFSIISRYFREVLPTIADFYQMNPWNLSLWTLGKRIFHGIGADSDSDTTFEIIIKPLLQSPFLSNIISVLIPLIFLMLAAFIIWKYHRLEWSFSLLILCTIIVNPLSWPHYFVLAVFPIMCIVQYLIDHEFPSLPTNTALILFMFLLPNIFVWKNLALSLSGISSNSEKIVTVPFFSGLVLMTPTFALCALFILCSYIQIQLTKKQEEYK